MVLKVVEPFIQQHSKSQHSQSSANGKGRGKQQGSKRAGGRGNSQSKQVTVLQGGKVEQKEQSVGDWGIRASKIYLLAGETVCLREKMSDEHCSQ